MIPPQAADSGEDDRRVHRCCCERQLDSERAGRARWTPPRNAKGGHRWDLWCPWYLRGRQLAETVHQQVIFWVVAAGGCNASELAQKIAVCGNQAKPLAVVRLAEGQVRFFCLVLRQEGEIPLPAFWRARFDGN